MTTFESSKCSTLMPESVVSAKIKSKKKKNHKQKKASNGPCKSLIPSLEWQEKKIKDFKNVRKYLELQPVSKQPYIIKILRDEALEKFDNETPTLSEIIHYQPIAKVKLLNLIRNRLPQFVKSTSNKWGVWSYAIMLSMQDPLDRESHCALRKLAKECFQIRSTLAEDTIEEIYVPLNLVICIVARVFGQLDLAEN